MNHRQHSFHQVELMKMKPGRTVMQILIYLKGSLRQAVDKWGQIDVIDPATFVVKEDNNLLVVEYELVNDKWGQIDVIDPATFVVKEDNNLSVVEYKLVNV
ncbi:unnamed protein product [Lactuca saligna]|uniref:Uncharacterized protein n=1 Tax=Lactuca saligna TaxID=75948 RepID=A0AA36E3W4_LACSI|nr:unnamed protein product [Lactuca saligna]